MQHHGGAQGFTELLLSMGFPGVDSGWIETEEVFPAEFRLYTEIRSGESNSSGTGSGGGGSGELYDGLDGGSRASTEDGAPGRTESPRSPEPWGNRGCDVVPEELEGDFPPGLYTETNTSTHTVISSSDGEDLNTHEDYCSERPQDTQTSKKRPLVIDIDEVLPGGPSDSSAEKPSVAHTWEKRPRLGKIPDFRTSTNGRKSALEAKLRKFGDRKSDAVVTPVSGLEFDSLAEAFDFYNLYSWEVGFGIRYGTSRKNIAKSLTMQEILCGCAGSPRHEKTRSMACGCQAMIRLKRTDDHGWYIDVFRETHNHSMSVSCGEKMHWPSHRHIDPHTKSLVRNLRDNNVGLSKVYTVIGSFFGSMENIPFNKRSLRSLCASISKDHSKDDVRQTVQLFSELKKVDPNFVDSCHVDKDGRIRALMWTSGKSRMQYKHFGDAITFDTTYRTNQYDMPFGLFVGVNNHFQSIIFGGVLMTNETTEAFEWVFSEFVSLMGGKAPATILTDQCRAMEIAIGAVLPLTKHRWCKWHVLRKAKENLGPVYAKNAGFRDELHKICHHMLTIDEFESAWGELIGKYALQDHPFLTQIYDVRHKWAKPYFSGVFCARMTSTQRSESANHMLKLYVPPGCSMNMFVRGYNKLQFQRDEEENFEEKRSRLCRVLLNSGGPIEKHASKIYTPSLFELFEVQIFQSASYTAQEIIRGSRYIVIHFDAEKRERWSRGAFEVRIDTTRDYFQCDCGMYEHMGMICCHVIRVLSFLGRTEIPGCHIMQRWTRNACRDLPEHLRMYQKDSPALQSTSFRHTALYRTALEMVQLGDSNPESFEVAMSSMLDAMPKISEASRISDGLGLEQRFHTSGTGETIDDTSVHGVDPERISLSPEMIAPYKKADLGRPTSARAKPGYEVSVPRTRFCSVCRSRHHNAGACPSVERSSKKPRREARCSNCGVVGHKKNVCISKGYTVSNR